MPIEEWRAYNEKRWAIRRQVVHDDDNNDEHGASIAWNNIHDQTWSLIDAITTLAASKPPQTLAGLAVLARTMTLSWSELWDEDDEDRDHRAFMEAVCAFAGVKPVPKDGAAPPISREPQAGEKGSTSLRARASAAGRLRAEVI